MSNNLKLFDKLFFGLARSSGFYVSRSHVMQYGKVGFLFMKKRLTNPEDHVTIKL